MKRKELDWIEACPEGFREKLRSLISLPPGSEGSESYYKVAFPEEMLNLNEGDLPVAQSTPEAENYKKLHKIYAQAWGQYAEALTIKYLIERGDPFVEWNWRPESGKGEIDIITRRGNRIVFIEVKARCGHLNDAWEAVDAKKIRELCRGADRYLKLQLHEFEYQFDIALVSGNYKDYRFEYIEDAFVSPLSFSQR